MMVRTLSFAMLTCLLAPLASACPTATDMSKGVAVKTLSPRGESNTFTFRKTGPGRIDELRVSQWIAVSNTVQRRLHQGLLPANQKVLKAPQNSQVLQDETYTYTGQNVKTLELQPGTSFTLDVAMQAADGLTKKTRTNYELGRAKSKKIAGCRLEVITIKATEDWDGIETIYTYLYFPTLGFGVQTEAAFPGKTFSRKIIEIGAAKP